MMTELRCPVMRLVDGRMFPCNSLCAKASPMSAVELVCRRCKVRFEALVNSDGEVNYLNQY